MRTAVASTRSRGTPAPARSASTRFADPWERFREVNQSAVLRLVAHLSPALVIAVLLSAPSIAPGGLDVTDRAWRDPYIGPCRRDRESSDAPELALVADRDAVAVGVGEPAPAPLTANAGLVVVRVAQPRELRGGYAIARDVVAHDERSKQSADQSRSNVLPPCSLS